MKTKERDKGDLTEVGLFYGSIVATWSNVVIDQFFEFLVRRNMV